MDYQCVCKTLSNKLEVFIATSPSAGPVDCVALNVGVGSAHGTEPETAHLLEHILFHITKDGTTLDDLVKTQNKYINGLTYFTHTSYVFTTHNSKLEKCLELLANMVNNPQITDEMIDKETGVVETEFNGKLADPNATLYVLSLEGLPDDNPVRKWISSYPRPNKNKKIYEAVRKFADMYYSADIMRLIIVTRMDATTLMDTITRYFSDIPNKNVRDKTELPYPLTKYETPMIIEGLAGGKLSPRLEIQWQVPYIRFYESPLDFICNIMMKFDLDSLKDKILSLATVDEIYISPYKLSSIRANIIFNSFTEPQYDEVLDILYNYIEFLKDKLSELEPSYDLWNTRFWAGVRSKSPPSVLDTVSETLMIPDIPLENGLAEKTNIIKDFQLIKKHMELVLSHMTPQNAIITKITNEESNPKRLHPRLGFEVRKTYVTYDPSEKDYGFQLVKPNPYFSTQIGARYINLMMVPMDIEKSDTLESYWFSNAKMYPTMSVMFNMNIKYNITSKEDMFWVELYNGTLYHMMKYELVKMDEVTRRLSNIAFNGSTDFTLQSNPEIVEEILPTYLEALTPEYLEANFTKKVYDNTWKGFLTAHWNFQKSTSYDVVQEFTDNLVCKYNYTFEEFMEHANKITFEEAKTKIGKLLKKGFKISLFISGNIDEYGARYITQLVKQTIDKGNKPIKGKRYVHNNSFIKRIKKQALEYKESPSYRKIIVRTLPVIRINLFFEPVKWKYDTDDLWITDTCLYIILSHLMDRPFFDAYRSEVSGYEASTKVRTLNCGGKNRVYLSVGVTANWDEKDGAIEWMENYITRFGDFIANMKDPDFSGYRSHAWDQYDKMYLVDIWWLSQSMMQNVILSEHTNFNIIQRFSLTFPRITKQHMIEFYERVVKTRRTYLAM